MGRFSTGDIVTVTISNFKVTDPMGYDSVRGVAEHVQHSSRGARESNEIYIGYGHGNVKIEKASRAGSFCPQPGDVYKADGDLWYVRKYEGRGGTVVIENMYGETYSDSEYNLSDELEKFALRNPLLLMRDGKRHV